MNKAEASFIPILLIVLCLIGFTLPAKTTLSAKLLLGQKQEKERVGRISAKGSTTKYTLFYFPEKKHLTQKWELKDGYHPDHSNVVSWGSLKDANNENGWFELNIKTNHSISDELKVYGAGIMEGALSWEIIHIYYQEYKMLMNSTLQSKIDEFVNENIKYLHQQIQRHKDDPNTELRNYWRHIELLLMQLEGLYFGYQLKFNPDLIPPNFSKKKMELHDFILLQMDGDLYDLYGAFGGSEFLPDFEKMDKEDAITYAVKTGRCSALIKYTPDRKDLLVSHATWDTFANMLRVYKHVDVSLSVSESSVISFSSTPGWLVSVDDWYITGAGLIVTETTNNIYNLELYKHLTPQAVLFWMRNLVANRMSKTAKDWIRIFSYYNSGTYNNQWMIVDTKQFTEGASKSSEDLAYILEQLPGMIKSESISRHLDEESYWPSYNIPYFPEIYNVSGYEAMREKHGDYFSYSKCPRAKIFARDHNKVKDIESLKAMIRYNDWKNDPFSEGDACNSIAARCDLNDKSSPRHMAVGAIDAKVTSISLAKSNLQTIAQNGPSHDQQPVFVWTDEWKDTPHFMQPIAFNFDWTTMEPEN